MVERFSERSSAKLAWLRLSRPSLAPRRPSPARARRALARRVRSATRRGAARARARLARRAPGRRMSGQLPAGSPARQRELCGLELARHPRRDRSEALRRPSLRLSLGGGGQPSARALQLQIEGVEIRLELEQEGRAPRPRPIGDPVLDVRAIPARAWLPGARLAEVIALQAGHHLDQAKVLVAPAHAHSAPQLRQRAPRGALRGAGRLASWRRPGRPRPTGSSGRRHCACLLRVPALLGPAQRGSRSARPPPSIAAADIGLSSRLRPV